MVRIDARHWIAPSLVTLALTCALIQTSHGQADPAFTPSAMRAHVEFLADDLLEGRLTGTRGYDVAAAYVASRFDALGLKPVVNGSWYQ